MVEFNVLSAIGIVVVGSVIGHTISHLISKYTSFEEWLEVTAKKWF